MVALPVDPAIGADRDARQDPHAALLGVARQLLRGGDPAMAVAQEAVDRHRRDAMAAAEADEAACSRRENRVAASKG